MRAAASLGSSVENTFSPTLCSTAWRNDTSSAFPPPEIMFCDRGMWGGRPGAATRLSLARGSLSPRCRWSELYAHTMSANLICPTEFELCSMTGRRRFRSSRPAELRGFPGNVRVWVFEPLTYLRLPSLHSAFNRLSSQRAGTWAQPKQPRDVVIFVQRWAEVDGERVLCPGFEPA